MSTARIGHDPIAMRRVDRPGDRFELGDFAWSTKAGKRSLWIVIPCPGRDGKGVWSEWTIGFPNDCGAQWSWDGNEDKPTLSPSLHAVGIWHGWVRDGMLVEA